MTRSCFWPMSFLHRRKPVMLGVRHWYEAHLGPALSLSKRHAQGIKYLCRSLAVYLEEVAAKGRTRLVVKVVR